MLSEEYDIDGRNPWELEPYYSRHVIAMTREELHGKSDIACELAFRDKRIADVEAELLSLREQLAAINGPQEPVGFVKCDPCAEDCRWDCVDPIYLAGSVTPEGYGSDYFEVYRHPAPLKE